MILPANRVEALFPCSPFTTGSGPPQELAVIYEPMLLGFFQLLLFEKPLPAYKFILLRYSCLLFVVVVVVVGLYAAVAECSWRFAKA